MLHIYFMNICKLIVITVCFLFSTFISSKSYSGEVILNEINSYNASLVIPYDSYASKKVDKYINKNDLLDYMESPIFSDINHSLENSMLTSYALPYYGNIRDYSNETPLSKYSTGITRFSRKSMSIFDKEVLNTLIADDVSNILLNSVLGVITNNVLGLNIWSSTDIDYISGFEASVRPFTNMKVSYSYMSEQNLNTSALQVKFGYNSYSNIAVKNMYTFKEKEKANSTTGVEWQFYF